MVDMRKRAASAPVWTQPKQKKGFWTRNLTRCAARLCGCHTKTRHKKDAMQECNSPLCSRLLCSEACITVDAGGACTRYERNERTFCNVICFTAYLQKNAIRCAAQGCPCYGTQNHGKLTLQKCNSCSKKLCPPTCGNCPQEKKACRVKEKKEPFCDMNCYEKYKSANTSKCNACNGSYFAPNMVKCENCDELLCTGKSCDGKNRGKVVIKMLDGKETGAWLFFCNEKCFREVERRDKLVEKQL